MPGSGKRSALTAVRFGRLRLLSSLAGAALLLAWLTMAERAPLQAAEASDPFDISRPTAHFPIENPADLDAEGAERIYRRVLPEMTAGYGMSRLAGSADYTAWPRFNRRPYRSAQHGERFVNNYGNHLADSYGEFEQADQLPQGAVLAKDSFTVTTTGDVFSGALFLMEKMSRGFYPRARDWRYSMILPDGSVLGITLAEGSDRVEFCIDCHEAAGDEQDHLFYIPDAYRR